MRATDLYRHITTVALLAMMIGYAAILASIGFGLFRVLKWALA